MRCGLGVPSQEEDIRGQRQWVLRDDRNRNARLARLRVLVPTTNAIVGIDLADAKQMVVVCDHDSKCWNDRVALATTASPPSRPVTSAPASRR